MILCKYFRNEHTLKGTNEKMTVELQYSIFHKLSGNKVWFCRIWVGYHYEEFYSINKFNAYRQAYYKIHWLLKKY